MDNSFKYSILFLLALASSLEVYSVDYSLYLNRDTITLNEVLVHGAAFNWDENYHPQNAVLNAEVGEQISVVVFNTDTIDHDFTIEGYLENDNTIAPGASEEFVLTISEPGTYRFYSSVAEGKLLGASGQLLIGYQDDTRFYWNLFDLEHELTAEISTGLTDQISENYRPELFFINGFSYPETLEDSVGYVTGTVGEEIIISIVNSGNMDHILHFHGYHVEILQAVEVGHMTGWTKDSVPVKMNETITLRLVPHQPGVYPVHDHNLIAVTNIGFYPGGMITHLNITE